MTVRRSAASPASRPLPTGQVRIQLGFGRSGIGPDVSVQPGAVVAVIDQEARLARTDPSRWRTSVLEALLRWDDSLDWCPVDPGRLSAALGALTHPLLAPLYRRGARAIDDIPRWSSPVLRTIHAGDAARVLSGGTSNRRLTRSLASSLVPRDGAAEGPIDLAPLALAVAGRALLGVDHLANVLDARPATPVDHGRPVPSVDDIRSIEAGLMLYPEARAAALLVSGVDDPCRLARSLTRLSWVEHRAPRPLPLRLDELEALCERLVPVVRDDVTAPTTRDAPVEPTRSVRQPRLTGRQVLTAPVAPGHGPTWWSIPSSLVEIAGLRTGDLTFLVPTSTATLRQWGSQLRNCLGDYGPAVAHERSWLIGLEQGDRLIGCIEVAPSTRRVRQAHGPRNGPLPRAVHRRALTVLAQQGIVRA